MNRLLGYSFMSLGLLGFFFFLRYTGTTIPLKELWFVLSIFIIIVGAYFFAKYKLQKFNDRYNNVNAARSTEIDQLKRTGDKVRLTLDNAEVKSRSYQQEISDEGLPSRMEMLDALYDSNRNYKTQEIQQTYIVFYKQYNGRTYKFVSQPTTQSADAVKLYIERQKGFDLYIDRRNPANYYFDFPFV